MSTLGITEASRVKKMQSLPTGSHSLNGEIYAVVREIQKIKCRMKHELGKEELYPLGSRVSQNARAHGNFKYHSVQQFFAEHQNHLVTILLHLPLN